MSQPAVVLRDVAPGDDGFLRALYVDGRPELAALQLPPDELARLVDLQISARRRQYLAAHPSARDQVIEVGGDAVGRCWTAATAHEIRVLDLAVLARHRRQGIATSVLTGLSERAAATSRPLRLSVWCGNVTAHRLYERLGFRVEAETDGYLAMVWTQGSPVAMGRR